MWNECSTIESTYVAEQTQHFSRVSRIPAERTFLSPVYRAGNDEEALPEAVLRPGNYNDGYMEMGTTRDTRAFGQLTQRNRRSRIALKYLHFGFCLGSISNERNGHSARSSHGSVCVTYNPAFISPALLPFAPFPPPSPPASSLTYVEPRPVAVPAGSNQDS